MGREEEIAGLRFSHCKWNHRTFDYFSILPNAIEEAKVSIFLIHGHLLSLSDSWKKPTI